MSDERRLSVLRAIVEDYVRTRYGAGAAGGKRGQGLRSIPVRTAP